MTTKIGFCRYCNNQRMVEVPDDATEELINQEATATCDCYRAKAEREKEYQKEACIANIDDMLGKKYPEIASLLKDSIDAIQASKIKKITVNTHFNQTIRLQKAAWHEVSETEKTEKEKRAQAQHPPPKGWDLLSMHKAEKGLPDPPGSP